MRVSTGIVKPSFSPPQTSPREVMNVFLEQVVSPQLVRTSPVCLSAIFAPWFLSGARGDRTSFPNQRPHQRPQGS